MGAGGGKLGNRVYCGLSCQSHQLSENRANTSPKAFSLFEPCFHKRLVTPASPLHQHVLCFTDVEKKEDALASLETVSLLQDQAEIYAALHLGNVPLPPEGVVVDIVPLNSSYNTELSLAALVGVQGTHITEDLISSGKHLHFTS